MEQEKKFKIFSNCIPVKGARRSTLCDLQRNDVTLIPNDLADILIEHDGKSIKEIKEAYENKHNNVIDEYFEYLIDKEYIFFTDNPLLFPKMNFEWDDPSEINNAIIDRNNDSVYDLIDVIDQLDEIRCRHIELRFFDEIKLKELITILNHVENKESNIISIDIMLPYCKSLKNLNEFLIQHIRVASLKIYNSPENKYIPPIRDYMGFIIYTDEIIRDNTCCGRISKDFFVVNTNMFTESKGFNTCLNRKVGIDINGDIKNCPSMKNNFGNIKSRKICKSISNIKFRNVWSISKDDVNICKDCEFRHICTDCRAFLENPDDIYSKPLKCGYNPYTNEWENWASSTLKSKTADFYNIN